MEDSTRTGADFFVDALESYGVTRLFGNPGTTELPVMDAVSRSDLSYVLALHEDVAVGMASGYSSARRYHAHRDEGAMPLGVVNLHVAPGMAHGLGNLYGAARANAPVVVTAGAHSTDFQHEEPNLQGDTVEMTRQFTKWSAEVKHVDALPTMLRRAVRTALAPPTGPVFLALPLNVTLAETTAEPEPLGTIPTAGRGDPDGIAAAVGALLEADDPVLVLGDQVARGGDEVVDAAVALAEASGARVHGEMTLTEVAFPNDHEQWISRVPFDEAAAADAMDADVVVLVGSVTNRGSVQYESDVFPRRATTVEIGHDAWELGKNRPADVSILGDPGLVMAELAADVADRLPTSERERRLEAIRAERRERNAADEAGASDDGDRYSKAQLGRALVSVAASAFVVDEAITSSGAVRDRSSLEVGGRIGNKGGGLGYGLPAAVGAAVAHEEADDSRPVLGFVGDGSYLYYPNAMYTAARYDLDVAVVVSNNANYHILKENTVKILGGERDDYDFVGMDFDPPVDLVANAESHGASARRVDAADDLEAALRWCLDERGPTLLDVQVHD